MAVAQRHDRRPPQSRYEINLGAVAGVVLGLGSEQGKRAPEVGDCLGMGVPTRRDLTGPAPVRQGVGRLVCLLEVLREDLRLHDSGVRDAAHQRLGNASVEMPPSIAGQTLVGSVLHQDMLEHKLRPRRHSGREYESCNHETVQCRVQSILRQSRDLAEQLAPESAPDRGPDPRDLAGPSQLIQLGKQQVP
jgi:hypothetical protein